MADKAKVLKACTMVATERGYYGQLLEPGDRFEFKGGPKPSWAETEKSRAPGGIKTDTPEAAKARAEARKDAAAKAEAAKAD